jgi:hypothetical protein
LIAVGDEVTIRVTVKAPEGYNLYNVILLFAWKTDQMELVSTSNKTPSIYSIDDVFSYGVQPDGSGTEVASTEIKPSNQAVGPIAQFDVTFAVKTEFIQNGLYSADIFVGPVVSDFNLNIPSIDVMKDILPQVSGGDNSSWKLCGATNADPGPYPGSASAGKTPYADIAGISPTSGLNINATGIISNEITVTYDPGEAGENAEDMPNPLSEEVGFENYTTASAPVWTDNNPQLKVFDGWKLTDGAVDGAVTGTTVFDSNEPLNDILTHNITLTAQWRELEYPLDLGLPDIIVIHQKLLQSTHSGSTIPETFTDGVQGYAAHSNNFSFTPVGTIDGQPATFTLGDVDIIWEDIGGFETAGTGIQDTLTVNGFDITGSMSGIARVTVSLKIKPAVSASFVVVVPGDINRDGAIDGGDSTALSLYAKSLGVKNTAGFAQPMDEYSLPLADVNRDGQVDGGDSTAVSLYAKSLGTKNTSGWQ